MKIGIRLESFGLPLRRALQQAERLGVTGVQVDAAGDLAPKTLSQTGRREFRHLLRSHNMELAAVGCSLRRGLDVAENQQERIDHVKDVLALCFDLGPRIAIVQAGKVVADSEDPRMALMTEALLALGHHGDRVGAILALESGLEDGATLYDFLSKFDTGSLRVNVDPANWLINGFDPYSSTRAVGAKAVHVHAKDARSAGPNRAVQEVALGHGDIDWLLYVSALEEIDYKGWITIEREAGDRRAEDIAEGVTFLRRLVRP